MAVKKKNTPSKNKSKKKTVSRKIPKKRGPKPKSNAGRPPKLTTETVTKLETAFALGCTDVEACLFADISKTALYNYQHKHPEFIDRKAMLKERPVLQARVTVVSAVKTDPAMAFKFLERKLRKEFGPDNNYKLDVDADINSTSMAVTKEMSEEDAANIYRDFVKKGKK